MDFSYGEAQITNALIENSQSHFLVADVSKWSERQLFVSLRSSNSTASTRIVCRIICKAGRHFRQAASKSSQATRKMDDFVDRTLIRR